MCLTINKTIHPKCKPLIAKKDIYTLKMVKDLGKDFCVSPYQLIVQEYNKLLTAKFNFETDMCKQQLVNEGLHSIIDIRNAIYWRFDSQITRSLGVILCKIPKGSKYYVGYSGDIVSNKLILLQPILCNNTSRVKLNKKVNKNWTETTNSEFWEKCIKIAEDLGYKIGL